MNIIYVYQNQRELSCVYICAVQKTFVDLYKI